ncbi:MAG TPA: UvrD-helicase domain-containing protein [Thermoleophilaceae bacterium]|nr:UvrD-helicase domain-containing protein [Thermoleophilaceae bacterium]
MSAPAASDTLLEGLNEPQREAVMHGEGPLLILAGAGSGKTRVLTHRIARLVRDGEARPSEILAITFTNKAAQEMRERVAALVGGRARAMWVMTFHSACARMLRADAAQLGYTRGFTIYDEQDSLRQVKACVEELDVDPKRFAPRGIRRQISDAKNALLDAEAYRLKVSSFFEQTAADVYELYEQRMHAANAMDFDDLLFRSVNLFELFPEVRDRYRRAFRHVLVDEYQDTNHAQYRWLQLLCEEHRNLCVVGDDDQCLLAGTSIRMGDGTEKLVEDVEVGDHVLSCCGSGKLRPARVTNVFHGQRQTGVRIRTRGGRELISTAQHTHFAGYRNGLTPDMYMTYVMRKDAVGFRVGTTKTLVNVRGQSVAGVQLRAMTEKAGAAWVVSTHSTNSEALASEAVLAAGYGLPTLPFAARQRSGSGVMANQALINGVYEGIDSESGGFRVLKDQGHASELPHHSWQGFEGSRRNVIVTLCADLSGSRLLHSVSIGGRGADARRALEDLDFKVATRSKALGWRAEKYIGSFGDAVAEAARVEHVLDVTVRCVARLGGPQKGQINSLPFVPASSVRPGMAMFIEDGSYDIVETVERVELNSRVVDLNVEGTHNFVANGLITHNSIYGFRGADVRNVLEFENDYPDAQVVKLEQNYRSTQTILSAANGVISHNRERKAKSLWSDVGEGDPVHLRELEDEHAEARFVVSEIERIVDEGGSRDDVAVFYRTNAQSRVLEDMLVRYGVGYQVIGGTRFYERAEVKDALAYLTLLVNPSDTVAFGRIVNSPRRGIGQTSQGRLVGYANTLGEPVWDVAAAPEAVPGLAAAAVKAVGRFMSVMERLRERAEAGAGVGDLLHETLEETGYVDALRAERTIEAQGRLENLEELVGVAREYDAAAGGPAAEEEGEEPSVEQFLQQVALFSEQDQLRGDEGIVTLMTMHNAKGLEYDTVFIIGLEDGVFPHMRSIEAGDLEEERRLCYVGITRAKRELYLSHARSRSLFGGRDWNMRSRFLDEIPAELTDREEEAPSGPAAAATWEGGAAVPAKAGGGVAFSVGEDVIHANFGDGVVTGMEPGGLVVVRFASDGSERKLMADYAPLKKRG